MVNPGTDKSKKARENMDGRSGKKVLKCSGVEDWKEKVRNRDRWRGENVYYRKDSDSRHEEAELTEPNERSSTKKKKLEYKVKPTHDLIWTFIISEKKFKSSIVLKCIFSSVWHDWFKRFNKNV